MKNSVEFFFFWKFLEAWTIHSWGFLWEILEMAVQNSNMDWGFFCCLQTEFWICLLLTILGYIPGIIYAVYVLVG
jgi:hypothetical protein